MVHLDDMLAYNEKFVAGKKYIPYETNSRPNKEMVILTCMESRLIELLLRALNLKNGDVKMLKNAGAIIRKPYDTIMKSILVAIYELGAKEVVVIGHYDCGMSHTIPSKLQEKMIENGIKQETIQTIERSGIHFEEEFSGFESVEDSVKQSVSIIRHHPLLPEYVKVHGLVIDPKTGKVDVITRE